ncbi:class I SAM-dependent methyltransferase [Bradyrhizobium sp.]|jgi:SAM-dependent methyltransferase|uniref:class I SAM-dependent methyltransferase n=1 Tax=Bradyrhizobium sp. TaxID=376 RepID=UPI003C1FBFD9
MSLSRKADRTGIEPVEGILRDVYSDIEAYYSERVARHGATPLGVDWSCWATQNLRFVQLLKICDFSAPFALNDIGCGYGALAAFLALRHGDAKIDYLGVDLSRAMVQRARRRFSSPDHRFVVAKSSPRIADYSVASGIMNVSLGHSRAVWEDFVATMLRQMRQTSRRGFSVNFISDATRAGSPATTLTDGLYRTMPQPWIGYCESQLGCSVEIMDGYGMREFTLLIRCNDTTAD